MKKIKAELLLVIIVLSYSCNKLAFTDEELAWIPYKTGDTIVLKNNLNEVDTLFILEKTFSNVLRPISFGGEQTGWRGTAFGEIYARNRDKEFEFLSVVKKEGNVSPELFITTNYFSIAINCKADFESSIFFNSFYYQKYKVGNTVLKDIYFFYPCNSKYKSTIKPNRLKLLIWQKGYGIVRFYLSDGTEWNRIK